jgi:hypothetical protein
MKQYFMFLGIIGIILLSCEKNDNGRNDNDNKISLDSLVTISSNLPFSDYRDLMFLDENIGYALSVNFIAKTTSGGNSWITFSLPIDFPAVYPKKIQFVDSQNGYIIAGGRNLGVLLKTTDGGQNWSIIDLNTYKCPMGMFFLNNDTGFIAGSNLFVKTMDGGETWINLKKDNLFKSFFGVNFKNDKEGIVTLSNEYFKTTDGGITWNNFNTIDYLSEFTYFVENQILVSRNSSPSLFDLTKNEGIVSAPYDSKFVFLNSKQSIAAGRHYEELGFFPYNDIYVTNDGWKTYSQKTLSSTASRPCIAKMSDNKVMIIYSSLGESYVMTLKK